MLLKYRWQKYFKENQQSITSADGLVTVYNFESDEFFSWNEKVVNFFESLFTFFFCSQLNFIHPIEIKINR